MGMTVLETTVRPAIDSAHRPVREPVAHHSSANRMSGLQAAHPARQQSALKPIMHTVLHSCHLVPGLQTVKYLYKYGRTLVIWPKVKCVVVIWSKVRRY